MNIDNRINVVAGRPGAGKTLWAAREVVDCLRDENNIILYIGFDQEFARNSNSTPFRKFCRAVCCCCCVRIAVY